jgi:hypothetical protein
MSTLNLPTLERSKPSLMRFSLLHNTQTFESPLNRTTQTLELPGARWYAEIEWPNLSEADARAMKAFFAALHGAAGRFYLGDLSHTSPSGTALGAPLVKGSSQTGSTLVTDGWTPNQSALLLPGDYIGVNGELKIITASCASNANGESTIIFAPSLRSAPADNAAITVSAPTCTMRLKDDEQDQVQFDPERRPTVRLTGIEVF